MMRHSEAGGIERPQSISPEWSEQQGEWTALRSTRKWVALRVRTHNLSRARLSSCHLALRLLNELLSWLVFLTEYEALVSFVPGEPAHLCNNADGAGFVSRF